jgi:hypothetical protein
MFASENGPIYSFDVVVHPDYRHMGIGYELSKMGMQITQEEGFDAGFDCVKMHPVSPGGHEIIKKLIREKLLKPSEVVK